MELVKLVSMFVALGAVIWMGYEVIATSPEYGVPGREAPGAFRKAGLVFLFAVLANIVAGRLQRRN